METKKLTLTMKHRSFESKIKIPTYILSLLLTFSVISNTSCTRVRCNKYKTQVNSIASAQSSRYENKIAFVYNRSLTKNNATKSYLYVLDKKENNLKLITELDDAFYIRRFFNKKVYFRSSEHFLEINESGEKTILLKGENLDNERFSNDSNYLIVNSKISDLNANTSLYQDYLINLSTKNVSKITSNDTSEPITVSFIENSTKVIFTNNIITNARGSNSNKDKVFYYKIGDLDYSSGKISNTELIESTNTINTSVVLVAKFIDNKIFYKKYDDINLYSFDLITKQNLKLEVTSSNVFDDTLKYQSVSYQYLAQYLEENNLNLPKGEDIEAEFCAF